MLSGAANAIFLTFVFDDRKSVVTNIYRSSTSCKEKKEKANTGSVELWTDLLTRHFRHTDIVSIPADTRDTTQLLVLNLQPVYGLLLWGNNHKLMPQSWRCSTFFTLLMCFVFLNTSWQSKRIAFGVWKHLRVVLGRTTPNLYRSVFQHCTSFRIYHSILFVFCCVYISSFWHADWWIIHRVWWKMVYHSAGGESGIEKHFAILRIYTGWLGPTARRLFIRVSGLQFSLMHGLAIYFKRHKLIWPCPHSFVPWDERMFRSACSNHRWWQSRGNFPTMARSFNAAALAPWF